MKERHNAILEYITTHGKTEVSILAEKLHTSEVTIRKDLDLLEEKHAKAGTGICGSQ